MEKMTIEEMKKMVGTEFDYYYNINKPPIPSYIKAFDPKIGLTCASLDDFYVRDGKKVKPSKDSGKIFEDGTFCIIGCNLKNAPKNITEVENILIEIRDTGSFIVRQISIGPVNCSF